MSRNSTNGGHVGALVRLAVVAILLASAIGCHEVISQSRESRHVIVEGVVVQGDTFRVEPLETSTESWEEGGLPATVRLENEAGDTHQVACDKFGRFRVGPILLKGAEDDRLIVSCPGNWTLRMSRLLPARSELQAAPEGVIHVKRKITLPPRGSGEEEAPQG